jgi:hypothetical protein
MAYREVIAPAPEAMALEVPEINLAGLAEVVKRNIGLLERAQGARNKVDRATAVTSARVLDAVVPRTESIVRVDTTKGWLDLMEASAGSRRSIAEIIPSGWIGLDTTGLIEEVGLEATLLTHSRQYEQLAQKAHPQTKHAMVQQRGAAVGGYVASAAHVLDGVLPLTDTEQATHGFDRWFNVIEAVAAGAAVKPGETDGVIFLIK